MHHIETSALHALSAQEPIDQLLDESKSSRLRDRIRIALLAQTMSMSDAIALAELHLSQPCSNVACAERLLAMLRTIDTQLVLPVVAGNAERRRMLINQPLRRANGRVVTSTALASWAKQDKIERRAEMRAVRGKHTHTWVGGTIIE